MGNGQVHINLPVMAMASFAVRPATYEELLSRVGEVAFLYDYDDERWYGARVEASDRRDDPDSLRLVRLDKPGCLRILRGQDDLVRSAVYLQAEDFPSTAEIKDAPWAQK